MKLLACMPILALVAAMPKENRSTTSTSRTSSTTSTSCSKTSTASAPAYTDNQPTSNYDVPPSYSTSSELDTYGSQTRPHGYPTPGPPPYYYPRKCPAKTVTSIYGAASTITVTTTLPYYGTSCAVTQTASGSGSSCPSTTIEMTETAPAETSTVTETLPVVTITDFVVTPPVVTSTITLSAPFLKRRSAATCTGGSTSTITIDGYGQDTTSTVTSYLGAECSTITESFECASPTATSLTTLTLEPSTTTSTVPASTSSITVTLVPSTVTATLSPTTTFNVLRATGVLPLDAEPEEVALANSNNMYASLRRMPGASDGSYAITFDNAITSPETAAQFTLDGTNFLGTGNGATDYIANTFYTDRSGYFFMSPSADPADATDGYPAIRCSVDPITTLLSCNNGPPDRFKNQFTVCEGGSYAGFNPNGNLFLTRDPDAQECPRVTIFFERVVLFELIPPAAGPTGEESQ
ncbi:hypothetical protein Slin15195_G125480 [Septoria linicola]|uniref:Uncharacterized protein n=1 Tax=Septoria linicola TaxID=215465 RepID=A0A9Q9B1I0_9PEZI|nr:hypothetical protein Slin14017_G081670 [Septoria linicola]USW59229.1 hypothetical protein Slin15195_G125480 [Septoria linicola]